MEICIVIVFAFRWCIPVTYFDKCGTAIAPDNFYVCVVMVLRIAKII